jgi:crotonyl-CoA carboxylase/reductase
MEEDPVPRKLYDIDDSPPLGEVPEQMHAWLIRQERFGEPVESFKQEVVDVPKIREDEVLVYVMAAGVNYNNVWAATGVPQDVIAARRKTGQTEPFHIGGSDASGIVYQIGDKVSGLSVGDEVVIHCGTWSADCPVVRSGADPTSSPTFRTWGYETNWGSFAQFTRVQAHQCLPRPKHLSWASSASYMLVGASAYRMLTGWGRHAVRPNDVVLCWGGAGGLGSMAIQITSAMGGVPVAVVSSDDKVEYCKRLGAKGCINRKRFNHWGILPHWKDQAGYAKWRAEARAFGEAIWEVLGERRNPRIVFEHPGESTIPTSIFVCQRGGMVVICAGTTGYNATVDLRYLWTRQKRLQGSHFANDDQAKALNQLVAAKRVDPCTSQVFAWDDLGRSHQLMYENRHPYGNMAVLVGAQAVEASVPLKVADRVPEVTYRPPRLEAIPEQTHPHRTLVREAMHEGVITCPVEAKLAEVARLLLENRIHAVVVTRDDTPVGVVSQTDLVLARQGRSRQQAAVLTAGDVMTPNPLTCEPDMLLADAVTLMARRGIHRLFVTEPDEPRVPIGVLSFSDILKRIARPT